ncbi:hypothetical protein T484DRAFT_1908857 [Baffinella frigidus]|nr:hypothetical protein T484DRAFT_1908857 [Cryptophyta sp. CCMP2293]
MPLGMSNAVAYGDSLGLGLMKLPELKEQLRKRGLSGKGTKPELIKRLQGSMAADFAAFGVTEEVFTKMFKEGGGFMGMEQMMLTVVQQHQQRQGSGLGGQQGQQQQQQQGLGLGGQQHGQGSGLGGQHGQSGGLAAQSAAAPQGGQHGMPQGHSGEIWGGQMGGWGGGGMQGGMGGGGQMGGQQMGGGVAGGQMGDGRGMSLVDHLKMQLQRGNPQQAGGFSQAQQMLHMHQSQEQHNLLAQQMLHMHQSQEQHNLLAEQQQQIGEMQKKSLELLLEQVLQQAVGA